MEDHLTVSIDDGVRTLTLERPSSHNALNTALLESLADQLRSAEEMGLVVRGSGEAFCAGVDLEEARAGQADGDPEILRALQDASRALHGYEGVAVAALHGHVVGAGLELACGCTLRIAHPDATFRLPELDLGLTLTNGATTTLPALVGRATAVRMVLDGGPFDVSRMDAAGLVDEVAVEPTDVATGIARQAADAPREPLSRTLAAFRAERPFLDALETESQDVQSVTQLS